MQNDVQKQIDDLNERVNEFIFQFQQHNHDNTNSFWIQPSNLFGFFQLVDDASMAPTDTPRNGTMRYLYDNNSGTPHWYFWIMLPNANTGVNGWRYVQLT